MKKNDMLNEGTIRRFMKLATIDALSDKFVDEKLQESEEQELEERGMMKPKRDDKEMREGEEDIEEAKHEDDEMREGAHEDDEDVKEGKHKDDDEMREGADKDDDEMRESEEELTFEEEDLEERGMDMPMDRDDDMGDDKPAAGGMVSVDQLMSALEKALEDVLGQEVEVSQDDDEMEMDMDLDMDAADDAEPAMDMDDEKEDDEDVDLEEAAPKTDVVEEVYARVIQRLTQETKSNKK